MNTGMTQIILESLVNAHQRIFDTDSLMQLIGVPDEKRATVVRSLSRLEDRKVITRISKGIYALNKNSKLTKREVPVTEKDILIYYVQENQGVTIGYDLFNRNNISTQVSKKKVVLSTKIKQKERNIRNVSVHQLPLQLNQDIKRAIEALEIIQNAEKIQDFNDSGFREYMEEYVKNYNPAAIRSVLKHTRYKKQTIYNLDKILTLFQVESGLKPLLKKTSKYERNRAYAA